MPVRKLDTLLREYLLPRPYLLKIDVDGAELQILEGSQESLPRINVVVIEAGMRNFYERASFLVNHGFELFDIVDPCYYDDLLRQFDMIFANARMIQERGLDMQKQPFGIKLWKSYK